MTPSHIRKPDAAPLALVKNKSLLDHRGLIAGEWREVPDSASSTFIVTEPATATPLMTINSYGRQDFIAAIDAAHEGYQKHLAHLTARKRADMLLQWNHLILANIDDLSTILSLENGKTLAEAQGEVRYAASFLEWFAGEAIRNYGDTIPSSFANTTVMTIKQPVGVCAIITPWNFPAAMITRKIGPALAAGCAVVVKPPCETPMTAIALAKLALEAGVPGTCLSIVPTRDREASLELVQNPKVSKVSFTGSTGVGKILTAYAASTMKRVSMELGGNAPFIVFEDADIDKAAASALTCKFRCSGQTCVCANRFFVHESVQEEFVIKLVALVSQLKMGRGIDAGVTQGPLVNAAAVSKVQSQVDDALEKGARLRLGTRKPVDSPGFFFQPTILTGVTKEMAVMSEETFGPLAAVVSFQTEDEVISLANNTEFGLAGYFFSRDIGRVLRVSQKLQCGMIGVNTGVISAAESPFGGVKESGIGREGSKYGLAEFQDIKTITIGES